MHTMFGSTQGEETWYDPDQERSGRVVACKIKRQDSRKKNISHNDSELEKKKWAKQKHAWIAWTSGIKRGEEKKVSRVTNRPSAHKNEHHLE